MACTTWNDTLIERLYGEIAPDDDAALAAHLESCAGCRASLAQFQGVRALLRDNEPTIPQAPRVVVLRQSSRFRPALLAASILGAAVLCGAGVGAGFALGRGRTTFAPAVAQAASSTSGVSTDELVRREVDRRLASLQGAKDNAAAPQTTPRTGNAVGETPLNASTLRAELAKFERRVNGARAADLDYVLDQIAASELRVGDRIGKTNQALRTVAMVGNPRVNEQ